MIRLNMTREQWRTLEGLAIACPGVSDFTRDTLRAHGAFVGVSKDSGKSAAGIEPGAVVALLSAARHAGHDLSKRPRFLENPRFIMLRDVGCILSAALDFNGYVSDCH